MKKTKMLIQPALDTDSLDRALELAGKVSEWIDIMEVGTPLIKTYGAEAIRKSFPGHLVSDDMKTMDGGEYEASLFSKLKLTKKLTKHSVASSAGSILIILGP